MHKLCPREDKMHLQIQPQRLRTVSRNLGADQTELQVAHAQSDATA